MIYQTTATTPLESLPAIEREFAAGNYVESSRLLWKATKSAFLTLGAAHGLHTEDTRAIACALDEKCGPPMRHLGLLIAGGMAQDHAAMAALEYHELQLTHRVLLQFIRATYQEHTPDDAAG